MQNPLFKARRDVELAFKKIPPFEEVTLFHPDGMYVNDKGDTKQIVVVGPMHFTPQEMADHFNDGGVSFEVTKMEVLPGTSANGPENADHARRAALARGFIGIEIGRMPEGSA